MSEEKKISDEIMSDDELDNVSGGVNYARLADDSRFLNVLLRGREGHCDRYGSWRVRFNKKEVINAWKSVGVDCYANSSVFGESGINTYEINGKAVTQEQAWAHAEQVVGKHLEQSEWDW